MTASDNELIGKPAAPGGRTRVLVIDDDRKLCRLIRDYLEPMGYEVSAAHSGTDGVERAVGEAWDAVILDVMLPGLDSFEALKAIRRTSDVPVLMLTARGEEADCIVGLEMGADDYLHKTFPGGNCWRGYEQSCGAPARRVRSQPKNRKLWLGRCGSIRVRARWFWGTNRWC